MTTSQTFITLSRDDWFKQGQALYGKDVMKWKFKCPSCGHVASVQDWKDAGASENAVAFSCVGRYTDSTKEIFDKTGGPCNYTGGGLFGLNPVKVVEDGGHTTDVFAFADTLTESAE